MCKKPESPKTGARTDTGMLAHVSSTMYTWPQGYKTFFMLNSAEHKILIAHMYENIKKFSILQAQISLECYFSCS